MEEANPEQTVDSVEQQELIIDQLDYNITYSCTSPNEWGFVVDAVNESEEPIESVIAPHGGPDPDSEEYNPDAVYPLDVAPGATGSVGVSGLPEIAWYEWSSGDELLETIISDQVDFSACPADEVAPEPEPEHEPEHKPEERDELQSQPEAEDRDTVEQTPEDEPVTEVEEEVIAEVEQHVQLPETGVDTSSIALLGTLAVVAGAHALRRSSRKHA